MQLSFYKGNEGFQNERRWYILSAGMRYFVSCLVIHDDRLEMWQLPKSREHRQTSNFSASFQSTVPIDKCSRIGARSIPSSQSTDTGAGSTFGICSYICSCFIARSRTCVSSSFGAHSLSSYISSSFSATDRSPGIVA
jgi:hypothetical protein